MVVIHRSGGDEAKQLTHPIAARGKSQGQVVISRVLLSRLETHVSFFPPPPHPRPHKIKQLNSNRLGNSKSLYSGTEGPALSPLLGT